jgi:hypothetical protein
VIVQHRGWSEAVEGVTLPQGARLLCDLGGAPDGMLGEKGVRVFRVPSVRAGAE